MPFLRCIFKMTEIKAPYYMSRPEGNRNVMWRVNFEQSREFVFKKIYFESHWMMKMYLEFIVFLSKTWQKKNEKNSSGQILFGSHLYKSMWYKQHKRCAITVLLRWWWQFTLSFEFLINSVYIFCKYTFILHHHSVNFKSFVSHWMNHWFYQVQFNLIDHVSRPKQINCINFTIHFNCIIFFCFHLKIL